MPRYYAPPDIRGFLGGGSSGSSIADLIMQSGRDRADAEMRGAAGWSDAIGNISNLVTNGVQQYQQKRDDQTVQKAIAASMGGGGSRNALPAKIKPDLDVNGDPSTAVGAGGPDIASILGSIKDPAVRARAMKGIQDMQTTQGKFQEQNLQVQKLQGELKDAETKRQQAAADHWGTTGLNLEQHLQDEDGGITAANYAVDFSKSMPGADRLAPFARQAKAAYEEAVATGDKMQATMVADAFRKQVQPLIDQGKSSMSLEARKSYAEALKAARPETATLSEGQSLVDKATGKEIAKGAPKPVNLQHVETSRGIQTFNPQEGSLGPVIGQPKPPAAALDHGQANDVRDAVTAMKEGTVPPQLPGRASKEYVAIMAEAKRQGYNLAEAATDWTATQKHVATLNGSQQTRMAQAIDNASDSLDVIDDLAKQWKGGKYPLLNKGQLAAAKQGALGPEAQKIATKLEAQISDVTSELGNVYMGGNSPTDHALGLASKNLSADWSEDTLRAMTDLARTNLRIRRNSMRNIGVAGASENNPYAPKHEAAPAAKRFTFDPKTGQLVPQ